MNSTESTLEVIVDRAGGYLHWFALALSFCTALVVYQHPGWVSSTALAITAVFAYHTVITRHHRIQKRVAKSLEETYDIVPETTSHLPTRSGKEGYTYALVGGKWTKVKVVFLTPRSNAIAFKGESEMEFSSVSQ